MLDHNNEPPKLRSAIGAAIFIVIVFVVLARSVEIAKIVGYPFLLIPDMLGLVERVAREDVQEVRIRSVEITNPGRYAIYTTDVDWFFAKVNAEKPWLSLTESETGKQAVVAFVERGPRPYDTPFAKGKPIFTFKVETPGVYQISWSLSGIDWEASGGSEFISQGSDGQTVIFIVPDYTTGHETTLTLAYVLQIAVIVGPPGIVYYRRYQVRRKSWKALQEEKRRQSDKFWQARIEKKDKEQDHK